jgi:hypothetical protein
MSTHPIRTRCAAFAIAAMLAVPAPARAGSGTMQFRGLLDVVAAGRGEAFDDNLLMRGDSPFDGYGLRVFADAALNERLQVFSQMVLRDASSPYVDGAYAEITPNPALDLHLLAGKIPWCIGTWAPRTYSNRNPLIGIPLMYQYHTTLLWYDVPPSADALLATAGQGQYGMVDYQGFPEGRGMTLVDDSYWDVGVTLVGSMRPVELALGVTAGSPGWGSTGEDENNGKSMLGRLGLAPLPGLRVGVSGAYGPYLDAAVRDQHPEIGDVTDYHQKLVMADLELLAGHAELRAEGAHNAWETPTTGTLPVTSGYVELKYALPLGAFLAARWDAMRFGMVTDSTGERRTWDTNVSRVETGAGYRFTRDVTSKLVYQVTQLERVSEGDRRRALLGAQLSIAF